MKRNPAFDPLQFLHADISQQVCSDFIVINEVANAKVQNIIRRKTKRLKKYNEQFSYTLVNFLYYNIKLTTHSHFATTTKRKLISIVGMAVLLLQSCK